MTERSKIGISNDVQVLNEKGASRKWIVVYMGEAYAYPFDRQKDAIRYGRGLAIEKRCELVIKSRNGRVRRKISYGKDDPTRKG